MPLRVATGWGEIVCGLGSNGASPANKDVLSVGGGVMVRKDQGDIAQGGVFLEQRGIGCEEGS